uniref:Uncharacterized protein n=1 Tax=Romanomermis culicivorax TaxID=13658 RepID=A0A915JWB0_ROMCU
MKKVGKTEKNEINYSWTVQAKDPTAAATFSMNRTSGAARYRFTISRWTPRILREMGTHATNKMISCARFPSCIVLSTKQTSNGEELGRANIGRKNYSSSRKNPPTAFTKKIQETKHPKTETGCLTCQEAPENKTAR